MTSKARRIVNAAGALAIPLAIALAGCEWPGGMRSSYPAKDYDPRLTREAATGLPLIAAINRYHEENSAFPATKADLAVPSDKAESRWDYRRDQDGSGYSLFHPLGWDPSLQYRSNGTQGQWVFDPGDGSEEKPILLKP